MKEARYFFVPDAKHMTELPEAEAQHAIRVLRLKSGDEMWLVDGTGGLHHAFVTMANNKHCLYEIDNSSSVNKTWAGIHQRGEHNDVLSFQHSSLLIRNSRIVYHFLGLNVNRPVRLLLRHLFQRKSGHAKATHIQETVISRLNPAIKTRTEPFPMRTRLNPCTLFFPSSNHGCSLT